MTAMLRSIIIGAVAWLALGAILPAPVQADEYWNGYWGWYDNTYRPYYYRQSARPTYGVYGGYPGYYGPAAGYYRGGYGYAPYGGYYRAPGVGVAAGPAGVAVGPGGGGVSVGPLQFGWR